MQTGSGCNALSPSRGSIIIIRMSFPIKVCAICSEEFELKPGKPGFANHCPDCTESESTDPATKRRLDAEESKNRSEMNEARREAMRNLLYRKDS